MEDEMNVVANSAEYNDSSIDLIKGATRIRKRPASMLGSSGLAGARHGFTEMYGNALDEHSAGYGDRLDVTYYKDGSVSIRDYGRGVPLGWNNKEGVKTWNWHVIYNELYGGGKYNDYQEELQKITDWSKFNALDYNYLFSVGLNGLGAASTQYTSEFFVVKSYHDGKVTSRSFKHGMPIINGEPFDMFSATQDAVEAIPEEIADTDEPNGTFVHWKPDDLVFDNTDLGGDWLFETCKDIAGVAGIEFHFRDENTGSEVVIPAGTLASVVADHAGKALITDDNGEPVIFEADADTHGKMKVEGKDFVYICKCYSAIGLTNGESKHSCYHNSVRMSSGVQYEGIQAAILTFLGDIGKTQGVSVREEDVSEVFNVVVSTYSNHASFRNQTKDAVDDTFIYSIVRDTVLKKLKTEYGKGNPYVRDAVDRVMEEAKARASLKEIQALTRKVNQAKREKTPQKFVSCTAYEEKKYDEVELWITEGDSAATAVKSARDSAFQAVMPIRGKGLNVAKASDKRILENREIVEIFAILGTGFDLHAKGAKFFNIDDLRVGKIIFATDADEDGYQIRVLLFLMLYKLAPELIRQGKVFIAETPRFGIELTDGSMIYARNDAARDEILSKYAGRVKTVNRYKGLGEVDADILRETTVHPDTRTLVPVTCDFESRTEVDLIDALFGADKYNQRKQIISAVLGSSVADMLEDNALRIGEIDADEDIDDEVEYEEVTL